MKGPDLDKEYSEKRRSLPEFLKLYNQTLPLSFPPATQALLREFKTAHASFFKDDLWSFDIHRKKVMDWLRTRQNRTME